jgi:NADPH-dependent 2,4-dienoyl-CoA reductase/sulfur reductase-like enzyme
MIESEAELASNSTVTSACARIVIVGAGFAGLEAAKALGKAGLAVTLVDRQNHHLFQPLLYQVATAALSAPDVAEPVRRILRGLKTVQVLLGEVIGIDTNAGHVTLADGAKLGFDYLVLASGAGHSYFGHDQWARFAPGLKTIEDARRIRSMTLRSFELAERETDPAEQQRLMSIAVVGGGPTGVELAGSLAELSRYTLARDFRNIRPDGTPTSFLTKIYRSQSFRDMFWFARNTARSPDKMGYSDEHARMVKTSRLGCGCGSCGDGVSRLQLGRLGHCRNCSGDGSKSHNCCGSGGHDALLRSDGRRRSSVG